MKNRLLSIFAWVYLYTIGLILPSKLNKWAKNITKRGKQCSDTHSESQHISGLQNKPTAQRIIKYIKPWNDPQIKRLVNVEKRISSFDNIWRKFKSTMKSPKHLNKEFQNIFFPELDKELSKINKKLKTMSFDNQNQSSILLKGCSFFHRVTLSIMYSIKDDIFSREEFYKVYKEVTILYLTQIAIDRPYYRSDKKLNNEYIKKIGENEEFIELLGEVINILRHYCIKMYSYGKYTLKPQLLCSLGVSSIPASIIEGSNMQSQSQHLYR